MKTIHIGKAVLAAAMAAAVSLAVNAKDNGEETVVKAESVDLTSVEGDEFVSAKEQVERNLAKLGLSQEYNPNTKSMVKIGVAYKKIQDPANDKKFSALRTLKYMEAYLNAKAEIIRSIEQDMSAMDRAETFGEFIDGETPRDIYAGKVQAFKEKLSGIIKRIEPINKPVAEALSAPMDENFGVAIDEALAALGAGETAPVVQADGQAAPQPAESAQPDALVAQLRRELAGMKEAYAQLAEENKKVSETVTARQESTTKTVSRMPLLGAVVLSQTESWNKESGEYQIAVACVWSAKLEEAAKQYAMGNAIPAANKGPCSVREWLKKQDLSRMIGSRQYIDDRGRRVFLGIGSRQEPASISSKKAVERQVSLEASRAVAFAMLGDVKAVSEAKSMSQEQGDDSTAAEALTDVLNQKLDANIKGLGKVLDKEVTSPITGKRMMVSVYYLDPDLAKDSADILKTAYTDMARVTKATQRARGLHSGYEKAINDIRASSEEYNKAKAAGEKDVKDAVGQEKRVNTATAVQSGNTGSEGKKDDGKGKSKGGTYTGDAAVNTDF